MKAIINGKRFDTDKAILVGESGNIGIVSRSDFRAWHAGLYRTPRAGRYFLAGWGGAMTAWSRTVAQNSWSGGEGIIPLSREDALEWAERELTPEEIEAGFPGVLEDA